MTLSSLTIAAVSTIFMKDTSIDVGVFGSLIAAVASPTLCLLILRAKHLSKVPFYVVIVGITAFLSY